MAEDGGTERFAEKRHIKDKATRGRRRQVGLAGWLAKVRRPEKEKMNGFRCRGIEASHRGKLRSLSPKSKKEAPLRPLAELKLAGLLASFSAEGEWLSWSALWRKLERTLLPGSLTF